MSIAGECGCDALAILSEEAGKVGFQVHAALTIRGDDDIGMRHEVQVVL